MYYTRTHTAVKYVHVDAIDLVRIVVIYILIWKLYHRGDHYMDCNSTYSYICPFS